MEKTQPRREKSMERCFFLAGVGIFVFIFDKMKVFFLLCALTWRVNIFVSGQGKGMNWRNESTIVIKIIV